MTYDELTSRNLGILSSSDQEHLHQSKVLIIGCGGIGGAVCLALARTGISSFTLVDYDVFTPTNLNRQMGSGISTLGLLKTVVLKQQILDINPEAQVETISTKLSLDEVTPYVEQCDMVFPAADDYAFSLLLFRKAKAFSKPGLLVFPAGLFSYVTLVLPSSPAPEMLFHLPLGLSYNQLFQIFHSPLFLFQMKGLANEGGWQQDYFTAYTQGKVPVTQLAPFVWMAASLGAFELIKQLIGRFSPTVFPSYWKIAAESISKEIAT
jgi:hypothetical protein